MWDELSNDDERKQAPILFVEQIRPGAVKGSKQDKELQHQNNPLQQELPIHKTQKLCIHFLYTANAKKKYKIIMNGLVIIPKIRHSKGDKVQKNYITKKADEINLLAKINSSKRFKAIAEDFGYDKRAN